MKSTADKLKEIKELEEKNSITRKEYEALRDEILHDESVNKFNKKQNNTEQMNKYTIIKFSNEYITFFVILFLTLSFHVIPSRLTIFPKDHLSLSNTVIFESDVNKLISRYNNASVMERTIILQDPFINKLFEKDILVEQNSSSNEYESAPSKK